jgi:hypothetical protein
MKINTIALISELKAQIWLTEQGYEVFTNIKPSGPADLLAWDVAKNHVLKIDVKTVKVYKKKDGTKSYVFSSLGPAGGSGADVRVKDNVTYLGYCEEENLFIWY